MTTKQFATEEMREKLAQLNGEERFAAEYAALLHPIVYMDWLKQLFVKEFCGEDEAEAEKRWSAAVDKLNALQILYLGAQAGLAKMKSGAAIPLLCALGGRKGKMLAKLAKQIEKSIFYFFSTDDEEMYYALRFVSDWIDESRLTEKYAVLLESAAENFAMSYVDAPRRETSKLFFAAAERLIDSCSRDIAKNAAVLCRLYRAVGTMNAARGNLLKCIEMQEKALAAGRKYLGERDGVTLDCMRTLAYSCSRAGMAERGAELLEKRLNIYKAASGAESKAFRSAEKDFNEFCAEIEKNRRMGGAAGEGCADERQSADKDIDVDGLRGELEECIKSEGLNGVRTMLLMRQIENAYVHKYMTAELSAFLEKKRDLYAEEYGADSFHAMKAAERLACVYAENGRAEEGIAVFEKNFDVCMKTRGGKVKESVFMMTVYDVLRAMSELAAKCLNGGKAAEALAVIEKCAELYRRDGIERDGDYVRALKILAGAYEKLGRAEEAERAHFEFERLQTKSE